MGGDLAKVGLIKNGLPTTLRSVAVAERLARNPLRGLLSIEAGRLGEVLVPIK